MKQDKELSSVEEIVDTVRDITQYQYIDDDARDESMEEIKAKFPQSTQEQVELLYKVRSVKRAVAQLETELKNTLAYEMQGKAKKVGNEVVIGKGTNTYKPYDVERVLDYLGDDWRDAVRPAFRTTAIRHIAKERGDNPFVIFDSLFETITTGEISIVPEMKAPKKYQSLNDGEEMEI
tara:strand:- start:3972 stop:4505 length:534 start_codon:yes stop_codon:yes gene_type:complete